MAYTTQQQSIYDHLRSSLPRWLFQKWPPLGEQTGTGEEIWAAYVKMFDAVQTQITTWQALTFIQNATGIWLDQHAADRGTSRQPGESDASLRARLRRIEDVQTKPALQTGINGQIALSGEAVTGTIIEFRSDARRAFFGINSPGGFAKSYFARGYRLTSSDASAGFVVILSYPATENLRLQINEYIRRSKGGGIFHVVERRLNP